MYKKKPTSFLYRTVFFSLAALALATGCKKYDAPSADNDLQVKQNNGHKGLRNFKQVNLVANTTGYHAAHLDPTLKNAWGIAFSAGGTAWVNSEEGHFSDVYNSEGATAIPPVNIPSPGGTEGGSPTGIVFNAVNGEFVIPSGNTQPAAAARFIFVGVDGVVSAWNPTWGNHAFRKFSNPGVNVYTGLALANNGGNNYLYAANFKTGKINVWDKNWNPVSMPFMDPNLPAGYAPFNIQNVGGKLYVMYAKVGDDGEEEKGEGKGFVDIYNTDGSLVKRFVSRGLLNAPWGVAMAPPSFLKGELDDDDDDGDDHNKPVILVGNFGDGRITAYRADGKFMGQLRTHSNLLEIEGLWAISFPPSSSTIDPNRLYFAAGPEDEEDGLFGYIILDKDRD